MNGGACAVESSVVDDSAAGERPSYVQILRSSALIGGASGLNLLVAVARTKAIAMLLGPGGVGLIGVYASLVELARNVAQMGINRSGVRQIAEAVATEDAAGIARTVTVLRGISIGLGLVGALLLAVASRHISVWTFGDAHHAAAIAWLSLAVFFGVLGDSQAALVQGMRRIADLARIGVFGALGGAVASVALVAALRADGVVPAIVATAALGALASWWYGRAVRVEPTRMSGREARTEAAALLKLGLAFLASGLLMLGAGFAVRLLVLRELGLDAAGLYHATWTLGGLYVGIVLQAMGADFYPRLVGAIRDAGRANRLANEQTHVSLLLAGPGVVATLAFAAPVLALFYTAEFGAAVGVLRWVCLGMALRVITWPIGYIIVASNRQLIFFATEVTWAVVNVGLSWVCLRRFGLNGAGIAFFGSYAVHAIVVYAVVRRLTGFRWSAANWRAGLVYVAAIGAVFWAFEALDPVRATLVGMLVLLASVGYAGHALFMLAPPESLPAPLQRLLARVGAGTSIVRPEHLP